MGEWAMSDGATSGGREEKDKGKRGGGDRVTAPQAGEGGRGGWHRRPHMGARAMGRGGEEVAPFARAWQGARQAARHAAA